MLTNQLHINFILNQLKKIDPKNNYYYIAGNATKAIIRQEDNYVFMGYSLNEVYTKIKNNLK